MNLTILPASTTGNRDADAAKIAEIVAMAEKYAPGCRWAVQVQIPESMEHEPDDKTAGTLERVLGRLERGGTP